MQRRAERVSAAASEAIEKLDRAEYLRYHGWPVQTMTQRQVDTVYLLTLGPTEMEYHDRGPDGTLVVKTVRYEGWHTRRYVEALAPDGSLHVLREER